MTTIGPNGKTIGKTSPNSSGGTPFEQNNKVPFKYLGIYSGDEGFTFEDLFNNNSLSVQDDEIFLLYVIEKKQGSFPDIESPLNEVLDVTKFVLKTYIFGNGKGDYTPIPMDQIRLINEASPTVEQLLNLFEGANTQTFELGDITDNVFGDYVDYVNNTGAYNTTEVENEYFFLFTENGITYLYFFKGDNLIYGVGENPTNKSQYSLITTSQTPTTLVPSWQQTVDVNKNATKATLYNIIFNGGTFGGYVGASSYHVLEDPIDGGLYLYGYFITYQGVVKNHIVKVLPDGTIDPDFNSGTGFNGFSYLGSRSLMFPNGKTIFVGGYTNYNGTSANRIVRLNPDGSIDNTFVYGTGFNNITNVAVLDNNNKIYVGGNFGTYNGETGRGRIVRLNDNGTRDTDFISGTGFNSTVTNILVDDDNNIYVAGYFNTYKGVSVGAKLIKLFPNGDVDGSFSVGVGFTGGTTETGSPFGLKITSDNKLMVTGRISSYNGAIVNKAIKLNLDGSIHTNFNIGSGFNGSHIDYFFELPDGNYIFSGDFTSFNGTNSYYSIILSPTGEIVQTFPEYTAIRKILSDGRIIGVKFIDGVYSIGVLDDNYIINVREFDYSEADGKARYKTGGLNGIEPEEIMPRRLIEKLIEIKTSSSITSLLIKKTKSEIDALIDNSELIPGALYEISGVDVNLYGGTTVWLHAISETELEKQGVGKFHTPTYSNDPGIGIFDPAELYTEETTAYWGGMAWINLTGVTGNSLDVFTLDENWAAIPFDDKDYNVHYDTIKYDLGSDIIYHREDLKSSVVFFDPLDTQGYFYKNPIKIYQWGSPVVYNNSIQNSIFEVINFRGQFVTDCHLINYSYFDDIEFDLNTGIFSLCMNNSYFYSVSIENTILAYFNLELSQFYNLSIINSDFDYIKLVNAKFNNTNFVDCNLQSVQFSEMEILTILFFELTLIKTSIFSSYIWCSPSETISNLNINNSTISSIYIPDNEVLLHQLFPDNKTYTNRTFKENYREPLEYIALMNQSGTNAPIPTILKNTIGNIVWGYSTPGSYFGMLLDAFKPNETFIQMSFIASPSTINIGLDSLLSDGGGGLPVNLQRSDDGSLSLTCEANNVLLNFPIKIQVYD